MTPQTRPVPRHVAPTLVEAVRSLGGDTGRGFVFVHPDGTERFLSFQEMGRLAARRGASLRALGLDRGDRVALVLGDGAEFVLSLLAAQFAGLVPVPMYPQVAAKNVDAYHATAAHVVRAAGASVLLTTEANRAFVSPVAQRVELRRGVVAVESLADAGEASEPVSPDDLALIQFTSGSTSSPKGVAVTHANLAANAEAFMIHGLERDPAVDKGVSWLPLFHDMGLIGFVVGPLFTNVPCVLLPPASFVRSPSLWLQKIHQHRGTITYAPTFAYALVAKRLKEKDVAGLDLSCLRVAGCGAEPIRAEALRAFAQCLAPAGFDPKAFVPSYGMAEATLAITFTPLRSGLTTDPVDLGALGAGTASPVEGGVEVVDCGRVFPEHELAIVDAEGQRLGERRVGQIVFRGPSVTQGYYGQPALNAQTFKAIAGDRPGEAPWLHTGDLGYTVGARLFVCGRAKDLIIVRGRNYYPSDIEWAIGEGSKVRRGNVVAFSVGVDRAGGIDLTHGEEQLVVCCEGGSADAQNIRESVSATVADRFGLTVRDIVVVPPSSLPRTSSGKPRRRDTRQLYLDGALSRTNRASNAADTVANESVDPAAAETAQLRHTTA